MPKIAFNSGASEGGRRGGDRESASGVGSRREVQSTRRQHNEDRPTLTAAKQQQQAQEVDEHGEKAGYERIMATDTGNPSTGTTDLKSGPFNVLYKAVKGNTQVLVNVRNNHKLLGRVKAYDRHMNL